MVELCSWIFLIFSIWNLNCHLNNDTSLVDLCKDTLKNLTHNCLDFYAIVVPITANCIMGYALIGNLYNNGKLLTLLENYIKNHGPKTMCYKNFCGNIISLTL